MDARLYKRLQENPIIAAIRDETGLERCLKAEPSVVFVLYGDICGIGGIVERIKKAGKLAIVHADLITGLSCKEVSVDFLHNTTGADGIISTRVNMLQRAKELGMIAIFRTFVIDSMAYSNIEHQLRTAKPDLIEVLPALMPKVLAKVCKLSTVPVIAGGLVSDKEDVMALLQAGVVSISSTNEKIWFL